MSENAKSGNVEVCVSLNYKTSTTAELRMRDPGDCIIEMSAKIIGTDYETGDNPSREITLGFLSFYLIRVGSAMNNGFSLFSLFDTMQVTMDAGSAIYEPSFGDYTKTVQKLFPDANSWDDLLFIDRLEIYPFARGQNLGLSVLASAIEDWSGGCSLVLMKPFPLQLEVGARGSSKWSSMDLDSFPREEKPSFQRLRKYYQQLGFQRVGQSQYYALCVREKWTALEDLELPDSHSVPESIFATVSNLDTD